MKRTWKALLLTGMLWASTLLSGCSLPQLTLNPEDLYALPTLPAKYTELNTQISGILAEGAEYAAPVSGSNIQPVQLVDLDGDGREEAVAFFRNTADEKPLKIYIFTAKEDRYELTELIEGSGTGFYSVAYTDLDGDGRKELLVGWKATVELQVLEVYALRRTGPEALVRSDYVKYTAADLDGDHRKELTVIRADEEGQGVADYYSWQEDGSLASTSAARISVTMAELSQQGRVTLGMLKGETPALFITGITDIPRAITDILAVRNGELTNIALSETTGVSGEIAPFQGLYPTDISSDGLTEVPSPVRVVSPMGDGGSYDRVDWKRYDEEGQPELVLRTYHNPEDGWYLKLPADWTDRIWVDREVVRDESSVTFYILKENGKRMDPFLRITAIADHGRDSSRELRGARFLLGRREGAVYAAELLPANDTWKYGVTPDEVRESFCVITEEWGAGDY